jgi:hypothetical protein
MTRGVKRWCGLGLHQPKKRTGPFEAMEVDESSVMIENNNNAVPVSIGGDVEGQSQMHAGCKS